MNATHSALFDKLKPPFCFCSNINPPLANETINQINYEKIPVFGRLTLFWRHPQFQTSVKCVRKYLACDFLFNNIFISMFF